MIWLAWRQHRKQALFTAVALVVLAALMIPSGIAMHNTYSDKGLAKCVTKLGSGEGPAFTDQCHNALSQFSNQYNPWLSLGILFLILPLLVGLFWGAPLVAREVEHGTHRLVWTQGVSRLHWALVKFGLVGAVAVVVGVVYGLGMSWWIWPLTHIGEQSRFSVFFFDMAGLVPIGYTLFAVALGIFVGTVSRKVLPAMAFTLVGFALLRIVMTVLARPHYVPARALKTAFSGGDPGQSAATLGGWVLKRGIRNAAGHMVAPNASIGCPPGVGDPGGGDCGANLGFGRGAYNWTLFQPADRYWLFQSIETGIFLAISALLLFLAVRQIRRIA
ncbi:ABC transporter permease subunit [Angustibacter sp. McL0619]|uniref:ABC transporter permease subunit n=1 Tax=Angustibacter sp. McL0619 TaxID=3415676 RepID=UPI003CEC398C